MGITKRITRATKKGQCEYCLLADKRALRKGWPWCKYIETLGRQPDIREGHCTQRQAPVRRKK